MNTDELWHWITERHAIALKRAAGQPKPWTTDPILRQYRFCHVYRELDTVTQWIKKRWRDPHTNDPNLFFLMAVARLLNLPESLWGLDTRLLLKGDMAHFKEILHGRQAAGLKVFNSAYIVSTNGRKMDKVEYLADYVLTPLWERRAALHPKHFSTLRDLYDELCQSNGLGTFMAAQIVADLKHSEQYRKAVDWKTFVAPGPGSKKGLNIVRGRDMDSPWSEVNWLIAFRPLHAKIEKMVEKAGLPYIDAQDLQNSLCELSKWHKAKHGLGRPKQKYNGV